MTNKVYSCPEEIPLSLHDKESNLTLYHLAIRRCNRWIDEFFRRAKNSQGYVQLVVEVGEECAEQFLKKDLHRSLLVIAQQCVKIKLFCELYRPMKVYKVSVEALELRVFMRSVNDCSSVIFVADSLSRRAFRWVRSVSVRLMNVVTMLRLRRISNSATEYVSKLGVEIVEGFGEKHLRSELNWLEKVALPPNQLVTMLVDRPLEKQQEAKMNNFISQGAAMIRLSFPCDNQAYKDVIQYRRPKFNSWAVSFARNSIDRYLRKKTVEWSVLVRWWYLFFKKNQIKVWVGVTEGWLDSIAQRVALNRLNGILVFRQRSELCLHNTKAFMPAHLFLSWGKTLPVFQAEANNYNEKSVVIGHVFGIGRQLAKRSNIENPFQQLGANKDFVIAVFPNAFGLMHQISENQLMEFYTALMQWGEEKGDVVFVIKEKNLKASFFKLRSSQSYAKLNADKKIIIVTTPRQLLPYSVSEHADVTLSVNVSSAGLEAGIAGKRILMYYPSMTGIHPLEQMAKNRVVFDKLPKLMESLENIYSGKGGDAGLLGKDRDTIDPYADGKGPERMGKILNLLLSLDLSNREAAYAEIDKMLLSEKESHEVTL